MSKTTLACVHAMMNIHASAFVCNILTTSQINEVFRKVTIQKMTLLVV